MAKITEFLTPVLLPRRPLEEQWVMRAIKVQAALELKIANVPTVHWIILASDLEGIEEKIGK